MKHGTGRTGPRPRGRLLDRRSLWWPGEAELPADEVRRRSRQLASGISTHRRLAAVAGDAGGQEERQDQDANPQGHAAVKRALAWRTPLTVSGVSRLLL